MTEDVRCRPAHVELAKALPEGHADHHKVSLPVGDLLDDGGTGVARLEQLGLYLRLELSSVLLRRFEQLLRPVHLGLLHGAERQAAADLQDRDHHHLRPSPASQAAAQSNGLEVGLGSVDRNQDSLWDEADHGGWDATR